MLNNILTPIFLSFLAGISTIIGSLIFFLIRKPKCGHMCFALGFSAGVMIFVSFVELLKGSIESIGFLSANLAFFAGILFIYMIDILIPHVYEQETAKGNKKMMATGILVAVGIAIHNFPEGMTVAFASMANIKLGIAIAFAIALHNIPEGISIATPIYFATKSRAKAVWYSALSGLAEPMGALIGLLILYPFLNEFVLNAILAAVAGVMVFISFDELLPTTFKCGHDHISIFGIFLGMLVMALSLYLL